MDVNLSKEQREFLQSIDTPTVCNLVEMVAPERRGHGYTVQHLFCPFPDLPPIVGFAKTVTVKAKDTGRRRRLHGTSASTISTTSPPSRGPSIAVIEDLDDELGYGAFWGEVQSNIHKALGCLGVVTNGSIRDIPMIAPGFQMLAGSIAPSHAYVHVEDFGVDGDGARHGGEQRRSDPCRPARRGRRAGRDDRRHEGGAGKLLANEARIIEAARAPGASVETIKAAIRG